MKRKPILRIVGMSLSAAIFGACVWYILRTFRWAEALDLLADVDLVWLLLVGGAGTVSYWLCRTLRWFVLLRKMGIRISFSHLFFCSAISLGFSLITPLQSGEVLKVELLKKYGMVERTFGYSSFIIERVIDLVVVVSMVGISLLARPAFLISRSFVFYLIAGVLSVSLVGILVVRKLELRGKVGDFLHYLKICIGDVKTLLLVVLISCVSWSIMSASWQVSLHSLSIDIGFQNAIGLTSTVTLISILSLIPGAVGVSEVGVTAFLLHLGQDTSSAQAGALVLRLYGIWTICLAVIHLLIWKGWRSKFSRRKDEGEEVE